MTTTRTAHPTLEERRMASAASRSRIGRILA